MIALGFFFKCLIPLDYILKEQKIQKMNTVMFVLGAVFMLTVANVVNSRALEQPWKENDSDLGDFQDEGHYLQVRQPIAYGKRRASRIFDSLHQDYIPHYAQKHGPIPYQPVPYIPQGSNGRK